MALTAEIYTLDIELANVDRGVYESLSLKVAKHPSESNEYLVTRLLAYCMEYAEGIAFSPGGVSDPEWPAVMVRDLTGTILAWIEIGNPEAARLHKASKASKRVAVYTHKDPEKLLKKLKGEKIHNMDALEIYSVDETFVSELTALLKRRMTLSVTVTDGRLYLDIGDTSLSGSLNKRTVE